MTTEERLQKRYERLIAKVITRVGKVRPRGDPKRVQQRIEYIIKQEFASLDEEAQKLIEKMVREAIEEGQERGFQDIKRKPDDTLIWSLLMATTLTEALSKSKRALRSVQSELYIEIESILRRTAYSEDILSQYKKNLQFKQELMQYLAEDGFRYVIGKDGRRMRIDAYNTMLARTAAREAANIGVVQSAQKLGYDLVKFSEHFPTCGVCALVQGRVFSITRSRTDFPYLFELPGFKDGFYILHPNCRHFLTIQVEALWTEEQKARYYADAKKPLTGESRTQREIDAYNKAQGAKRVDTANRRQYERYKAMLGDDAPKSYEGFKRMKTANSKRWKEVQRLYRVKRRE